MYTYKFIPLLTIHQSFYLNLKNKLFTTIPDIFTTINTEKKNHSPRVLATCMKYINPPQPYLQAKLPPVPKYQTIKPSPLLLLLFKVLYTEQLFVWEVDAVLHSFGARGQKIHFKLG